MTLGDFIAILKLPFRKERGLYRSFYRILGFYPNDIRPYKESLLHKSTNVRSEKGKRQNNERLEFLGDAILDAVVGDIVYRHFPGKHEGFLTNTRSKIVQRETLNKIAVEIGLDKLIKSNGRGQTAHNSYMCGNAFEALMGAVYMDRGYGHVVRFIEKQILKHLIDIDKVAYKEVNFKSKLIEWSQKNRIRLDFNLEEETMVGGTTPMFQTSVIIEGIVCGQGKGYSKKESQQLAAKDALTRLKKEKRLYAQVFDAKGKRTAMEEEPQALLPDVTSEPIERTKEETTKQKPAKKTYAPKSEARKTKSQSSANDKEATTETKKEETTTPTPPQAKKERKPREKYNARKTDKTQDEDGLAIDFSDVSMKEKSRDEIIADAEAKAFAEE